MKLCFLAGSNSIHSLRWVRYFSQAGHDVTWISLAPSIFDPLPGVNYVEVPAVTGIWSLLRAVARVRKIIATTGPDVLHVHSVGTYGIVGLLTGFAPIIATPWGSDVIYGKESIFKRPFIAGILRRAARVTCDAWHMREEVMRFGVPSQRISIINFGIDTQRFAPRPVTTAVREQHGLGTGPVIISLRNFEPVYDIPTLLKAVPKVLDRHAQARFMVVGRGSLDADLKAMATRLSIDDAVRFVGFLPNDQLPETLCSMDIYVSTSLSDAGIAASTAEAMACGVPVVVSNSGENDKWITDGENGWLVPVSDPSMLAQRICELIEAPHMRQKLGLAGRSTICEKNDFGNEMSKMNALYEQVGAR